MNRFMRKGEAPEEGASPFFMLGKPAFFAGYEQLSQILESCHLCFLMR